MKQALVLIVAALALTACGKSVSNDGNGGDLTHTPTPPVITTPVPVPNAPSNTGTVTFNFANHGEIGTNDNLYTSSVFSEQLLLTIPATPSNTSFATAFYHPTLNLLINNSNACSYIWTAGRYAKHSSCQAAVLVTAGDVMTLTGVPQGETVTVKFPYQK